MMQSQGNQWQTKDPAPKGINKNQMHASYFQSLTWKLNWTVAPHKLGIGVYSVLGLGVCKNAKSEFPWHIFLFIAKCARINFNKTLSLEVDN